MIRKKEVDECFSQFTKHTANSHGFIYRGSLGSGSRTSSFGPRFMSFFSGLFMQLLQSGKLSNLNLI